MPNGRRELPGTMGALRLSALMARCKAADASYNHFVGTRCCVSISNRADRTGTTASAIFVSALLGLLKGRLLPAPGLGGGGSLLHPHLPVEHPSGMAQLGGFLPLRGDPLSVNGNGDACSAAAAAPIHYLA